VIGGRQVPWAHDPLLLFISLQGEAIMRRHTLLVLLTGLLLSANAQQRDFNTERLKQIVATIEAVNPEDRTLVLRADDNTRMLLAAGPEVRNLEQVKAGDRLVARYREAVAARVVSREESQGTKGGSATKQAAAGGRPRIVAANLIATTVTIDSVDTSFDTVTFTRSDGIVRTVAVEDPKAREFIRGLKRGDEVEIAYSEAVAVDLRPARQL
jgi:hypothetical protein